MGIRIHKSIGYGFKDLRADDHRVDMDKFSDILHDSYNMDEKKIAAWLKEKKDELIDFNLKYHPDKGKEDKEFREFDFLFLLSKVEGDIKEDKEHYDMSDWVVHNSEYGMKEVIQFIPIGQTEWKRYDNVIDYVEESARRRPQINWCKILKKSGGIYPWLFWVRMRMPKEKVWKDEVAEAKYAWIEPAQYSRAVGWWSEGQKPLAQGYMLQHLLEDYRPAIPIDVMAIIYFFRDAIKDMDAFVNSIRPMIYVYWG